jgi:sugar O-acyltransferase (sialic acid O-acetyltransferase NeuD family)
MVKRSVLTVPQLGVNDDRVKVVSWAVPEGGACAAGQVVCELETTKAIQEVEADSSGVVVPVVFAGEEVMVSQPLALIGDNLELLMAERDSLRKARAGSAAGGRTAAITVKARRVAEELGVDVDALSAEIPSGVVRESDVRAAYQKRMAASVTVPSRFTARDGRVSIAIYGAGAGGVTLKEAADLGKEFDVVCFLDDAADRPVSHCGLPVFHGDQLKQVFEAGVQGVATEIASASVRLRIRDRLDEIGMPIVTVIHPQAFVSPSATIGRGCFIKAGAIVETNSLVGDMCIIDNGVVVAHDNKMEPAVHLAPGVSTGGSVRIGSGTVVGVGSSIASGITVGENCIVSVGTAVTRNVPSNGVVEGVPGKIIGTRKN